MLLFIKKGFENIQIGCFRTLKFLIAFIFVNEKFEIQSENCEGVFYFEFKYSLKYLLSNKLNNEKEKVCPKNTNMTIGVFIFCHS